MQHNKKYCPAIVGFYYFVDGIESATQIAKLTGMSTSTVWQILNRKFNVTEHRRITKESTVDAIEREYMDGASTYELADKYGVHHATISKWMIERGHVRGKTFMKDAKEASFMEWLFETYGERFTMLEYVNRQNVVLKCNDCGHVFKRWARTTTGVRCPNCYESFRAEHKPKRHRKSVTGNIRKRVKKYGSEYISGITLMKVYEKDHGICQICGKPCDVDDAKWGYIGPNYPTIDHIIALANGGSHTWGNVQLAHHLCNSLKRDLEVAS